ncbi:MAG: hypothetical protein OXQ94_07650 [Gemmatimonadota bacterium]|nr:hypothetical protein [Gemmatimonadota bacterium]MDE2871542.1 hypothetical protein [Gemmatimonadota bacterium]
MPASRGGLSTRISEYSVPSDQTLISSERDQFSVSISMRMRPVLDSPRMRRSTSSMISRTRGSVWAVAGAGARAVAVNASIDSACVAITDAFDRPASLPGEACSRESWACEPWVIVVISRLSDSPAAAGLATAAPEHYRCRARGSSSPVSGPRIPQTVVGTCHRPP